MPDLTLIHGEAVTSSEVLTEAAEYLREKARDLRPDDQWHYAFLEIAYEMGTDARRRGDR